MDKNIEWINEHDEIYIKIKKKNLIKYSQISERKIISCKT
jgi:hypothetical protein